MVQYHAHRGEWDAAEAVLKTYPPKKPNAVDFEEGTHSIIEFIEHWAMFGPMFEVVLSLN